MKKTYAQTEIAHLQTRIKLCNSNLKDDPNNDSSYFGKASALRELGIKTKDTSYLKEALKCYTKAIDLVSDNPVYLLDRSELYLLLGNIRLAKQDFLKGKKLPIPEGLDGFSVQLSLKNLEQSLSESNNQKEFLLKEKLEALLLKIKKYEDDLYVNSKSAKTYHLKAEALIELAHETNNIEHKYKALECFNKAHELDVVNPVYIINRSRLLLDLATDDLKIVMTLPKDLNVEDDINRLKPILQLNRDINDPNSLPNHKKTELRPEELTMKKEKTSAGVLHEASLDIHRMFKTKPIETIKRNDTKYNVNVECSSNL